MPPASPRHGGGVAQLVQSGGLIIRRSLVRVQSTLPEPRDARGRTSPAMTRSDRHGAPSLTRPKAVLFDLFHTLVQVQPSPDTGAHTWFDLGIPQETWERVLFEDRPGRGVGRVRDPVEGMRLLAHQVDPAIPMATIERTARRRMERFDRTLVDAEPRVVGALARLRGAGVRIALVSNAGFDEIGAWPRSPLAPHFDATVFSCAVGVAKPDAGIYE